MFSQSKYGCRKSWPLVLALAFTLGCPAPHSTRQRSLVQHPFGVAEVDAAVEKIKIGVSTRDDIKTLLGQYTENRGLYRVKATGANRSYLAVPKDRQIWIEFATDAKGVERVSAWNLESKLEWFGSYEDGYITFSPDERPW